jgi:virulence factor Mce-like protein
VDSLPLPKPGVGGHSYVIHAVFDNVLNLPDHAPVKVSGSNVGVVTDITTQNFQAEVTMRISSDVPLPTSTTAELRQATPLGDMFVALTEPHPVDGGPVLHNGDTIGIQQTSAGASVEELLVSLSMLFDGGGIAQLAKLATEMDSIVGGRGPQLADLLKGLTGVVTSLHRNTDRIDSVLGQFNTTFGVLRQHKAQLGDVARSLPALVGVLAADNRRLGDLLDKVAVTTDALGDYATVSQDQLAGLVSSTTRLMTALNQAGATLGPALDQLHIDYPKILATMRGNTLTVATKLDYLTIGGLYDSGSRLLPDGQDVLDLVGSLSDLLRHVFTRLASPSDPNYDGQNYPGVRPPAGSGQGAHR